MVTVKKGYCATKWDIVDLFFDYFRSVVNKWICGCQVNKKAYQRRDKCLACGSHHPLKAALLFLYIWISQGPTGVMEVIMQTSAHLLPLVRGLIIRPQLPSK